MARDRWRRLGSGHEPVYVVSPASDIGYALHRWGQRELDVGPAGAHERHVVVSAVLSDLLGCAAPRALVRARLEDEGASAGGAGTTALTASDLRAWVMRHPAQLRVTREVPMGCGLPT